MSVVIIPLSPERLRVTGHIRSELPVPFGMDGDRFHLAFSDGTLFVVEHDPERSRFHFLVEIEGAGIARIAGEGDAQLESDWITAAVYRPDAVARPEAGRLPLFEPV